MKCLLILCALMLTGCGNATAEKDEPVSNPSQHKPAGAENEAKPAWSLEERENWVESVEVVTMESAPPQFAIRFTVTMPTPGWKLKVDSISKPDAEGRISVRVTGTPPEGMVAQVLQSETFQANLGSVAEGDYLIELHYRKQGEEAYQRKGTAMFQAGPR